MENTQNIEANKIKISFLITVYNQIEELKECIEAIIPYKGDDIEIVVSDDCSEDDLKRLVDSFVDARIKYYKNDVNLGHDGNILEGICHCIGEFVFLLRTRDYVISNAIPKIISIIDNHPNVSYISGTCLDDDGLPRLLIEKDEEYEKGINAFRAHEKLHFHPSGSIFRKKMVDIELMHTYHMKFKEPKMWFMVDMLIRCDLAQKGSFYLLQDPIWVYTYTERNKKRSVQPRVGGHLYTQEYTFLRYESILSFVNKQLDGKNRTFEYINIFKRFLYQATWGHKSRMENEGLIAHYGMANEEVDIEKERKKFIDFSSKIDNLLSIDDQDYLNTKTNVILGNIAYENVLKKAEKGQKVAIECGKEIFDKVVKIKETQYSLEKEIYKHGYKKIGIYGTGYVGRIVWNNLKNSELVHVEFLCDRRYKAVYNLKDDVKAISPSEINTYEIDCLIVTPIQFFDEIKNEVTCKVPIMSIKEFL